MSKKTKNRINIKGAIDLLSGGYSLKVKEFNFYQFRIRDEEIKDIFYDWYHTTGSLVKNHNGFNSRAGTFKDAESLAIFIRKDLEK